MNVITEYMSFCICGERRAEEDEVDAEKSIKKNVFSVLSECGDRQWDRGLGR